MTVSAVWNHRPIQDVKIYMKYIEMVLMISKDFHMPVPGVHGISVHQQHTENTYKKVR